MGAGFFFVEKKDKSLHPCIDYRGLNDITNKNRYPLPLISSVFELLQGVSVFSKLDLHGASSESEREICGMPADAVRPHECPGHVPSPGK